MDPMATAANSSPHQLTTSTISAVSETWLPEYYTPIAEIEIDDMPLTYPSGFPNFGTPRPSWPHLMGHGIVSRPGFVFFFFPVPPRIRESVANSGIFHRIPGSFLDSIRHTHEDMATRAG